MNILFACFLHSIPLLFNPNPSALREAPQFVNGSEDGAFRDIAGDFDLANFPRQDEVNNAILGFLVGLQPRQNFACADVHFRQAAKTQNCIGNAAGRDAVGATDTEGDVGRGNHTPGDGLAVQQASVVCFGFERVTNRVAQVEDASQAPFVLIGRNDFGFEFYRLRNQPFELKGIAFQNAGTVLLKAEEEFDVADDAALECFV